MTDDHVGRLLVASVHQAITDELPTRIDFYENWLRGERLRNGGVGLAPMTAVLGFLRTEGEPYHAVMSRAGSYAANWTRDAMPALQRRWMLAVPRWWRLRAVLKLAARAIRDGYAPSRAVVRVRKGQARIEIKPSLFCRVRGTQRSPQCDFHRTLIAGLLAAFNLPASVSCEGCAATGNGTCTINVDLAGAPVSAVLASAADSVESSS